MYTLLMTIHVLVSFLLIGIVLFQAEEGTGLSGAFGTMSGAASGNVFGKKGVTGAVTRFTAGLVCIFLATSFFLTLIVSQDIVSREDIARPAAAGTRSHLPMPSEY